MSVSSPKQFDKPVTDNFSLSCPPVTSEAVYSEKLGIPRVIPRHEVKTGRFSLCQAVGVIRDRSN